MTEENRRKVGEFLSEYIDIFERRELKKVILKNCGVLLEDEYFN